MEDGNGCINNSATSPGTQTTGYKFGIGQSGSGGGSQSNGCAGAGGGYYGGTSENYHGYATGGSSFISGNENCNAISENSTEDNIEHTNQPKHYSGKIFIDSQTLDGTQLMPSIIGFIPITGRSGDGIAKITFISN